MATKIQLRRDTAADWTSANPTLAAGEFGYESDTTKFKIGDGSTAWNSLAYKTGEGIKVVADDSATITVAEAGTLYVQGGNNVTTSTDSAGVLTINATGEVTGSSTTTFTNKTFDAEGTGNALSNVDVANLKSGVLDTDLSSVSGSDDTLASAKAIKTYVDANAGGGASTGDITFTGSTINSPSNADITLNPGGTGGVEFPAITINDNLISTNRSNDDLNISANGTGTINAVSPLGNASQWSGFHGSHTRVKGFRASYEDLAVNPNSLSGREYGHAMHMGTKVTADSSNSNFRPRALIVNSAVDMNSFDYTNTSASRGPLGSQVAGTVNNSASTDSNIKWTRGIDANAGIADYNASNGSLTVENAAAIQLSGGVEGDGAGDLTVTNHHGFYIDKYAEHSGSGAGTITNSYGIYVNDLAGTNNYAFYDATDSLSVFGDIQTQAVSIIDNHISTTRTNDNLYLESNSAGRINISTTNTGLEDAGMWSPIFGTPSRVKGAALVYQDLSVNPNNLSDREYGHAVHMGTKITADSTNPNFRPRALVVGSHVELDGNDFTNTGMFRGPLGAQLIASVSNGNSSNSTINVIRGVESSASVQDYTGSSGDVTVVNAIGNMASNYFDGSGSGDINITNSYSFKSLPEAANPSGGGTTTVTNQYGFFVAEPAGNGTFTNKHAFYSEDAAASSRMGAIRLDNQSGDPTHGADRSWIFAKDESSSSEVFVKDEAGNVTKISPHNEAGDWEYYSKNTVTGKTVRVNMERMIKKLEQLTGETFIESE